MSAWPFAGDPAYAAQAASDSIRSYSARLSAERDDRSRSLIFYSLVDGVRQQRIRITTPSEAGQLAVVMARLLDQDPSPVIRWQAAEFLGEHSHPAAVDALLRAAGKHGRFDSSARSAAIDALVSLHDARVLPEVLKDLSYLRPWDQVPIRRLAELGSPAGLPYLQSFAADTACSALQRETARLAERDLRLYLESGLINNFSLSDGALATILEDGFAILPGSKNEMFELYDGAYPFVTSDVMWHTFMILLRASIAELERMVLAPDLEEFSRRMVEGSLRQAARTQDKRLRALAERNAGIFAVPSTLLTGHTPDGLAAFPTLRAMVGREVDHIRDHREMTPSSLFGYVEDFTKYEPRGLNDSTKGLDGYYQAMMYLGRMSWRPQSKEQSQQILLALDVLSREPRARHIWSSTDSLLTLLFGEPDDPTFADCDRIARRMTPGSSNRKGFPYLALAGDPRWMAVFSDSLRTHRSFIRAATPTRPTRAGDTDVGLRAFGQRYTLPIHQLQLAMDDGIWPPSGLDVAGGALGSRRATAIIKRGRGLPRSPAGLRSNPYVNLAEGWVHTCRTLFEPPLGVPVFMRSHAWEEKQINSALGGWAELQNATSLFTKDANLYMGASGELDRFHGYVEPIPEFYSRLARMATRLREELDRVKLFERVERDRAEELDGIGSAASVRSPIDARRSGRLEHNEAMIRVERPLFVEFTSILERLTSLADKELQGKPQSIDDGYFLKGLPRRLMYLSFNRSGTNTARISMARIVDVASEYQSRTCLEIAVGRPLVIYASVPDGDGHRYICKGAVYSYYEFLRPLSERMDGESWKAVSASPANREVPWLKSRGLLEAAEEPVR